MKTRLQLATEDYLLYSAACSAHKQRYVLSGICTEVMLRGFGIFPAMLRNIEKFMGRHG